MSDQKLDLILKELREVKTEQQGMKEELQGFKQEQQGMKQEQRGMKQDLQGIKQEQKSFNQQLQNMKSQMNDRFDTLETKVSYVGERVDVVEGKADVIQTQVVKNTEDIAELKEGQTNILMKLSKVIPAQEQQEKAIDILARRSIDHEAELKQLK